jgi:hypothetical protein
MSGIHIPLTGGACKKKAHILMTIDVGFSDEQFNTLFGDCYVQVRRPPPLRIAQEYIARGMSPVPIPARTKRPVLENWGLLRLTNETAANHFGDAPSNIGVILGSASGGLVDIDQDSPEARHLASAFLPPTDCSFGRPGNPDSHWLYRAPGLTSEKICRPGTKKAIVELRSNTRTDQPCQTVFPGSIHESGEAIEWVRRGEPASVAPEILRSAFHRYAAAVTLAVAYPEEGKGRHDATLALVGALTRGGWNQSDVVHFVTAVREAIGADRAKTRGLPKMAKDAAERKDANKELWGLPTLREAFGEKAVKQFCEFIDYPPPSCIDAQSAFDEEPDDLSAAILPAATDPIVARLNQRHAVVAHNGRTLITTQHAGGAVNFGPVQDLNTLYANQRRAVPDSKTDRTEPISAYWLTHPERRTYPRGVTFAPGQSPKGMLNLWRGWEVTPDDSASCSLFREHVTSVICRGNMDHAAYVFGWLAHLVQRPAEKPGVAIVLRGGKGAGKDTVVEYLAAMIGRHHVPTVSHENHVVGNVQEGTWAGDRKAEGVLKYLVTSETVEIERKGIDSFSLPSFLRMVVSSNSDWIVPASEDERRWAVFEVENDRRGDESYFDALRSEMNGTGPAALLHFLSNYDLTGFNVRKAPDTEGLRNQKLASLRNIERWWYEMLCRGELASSDWLGDDDWSTHWITIGRDTLRRLYIDWLKSLSYREAALNEVQFGQRLHDIVPGLLTVHPRVSGRRIRQYVVPVLADCRAGFAARYGGTMPMDWGE